MKDKARKKEILDYHSQGRPGKIEVIPSKPTNSQRDLAIAYSPGVAEPCLEIEKNVDDVYKYTAKGNLVAVISNGTAVLGLGDIGPEASKPVMEGKGLLFKIFADIDVFDIELNVKDVDQFVATVKAMEPTFGGVNLEDIKAPECFEIERRLKEEMNIPVMHDDQHGTAIISSAALLNAVELAEKELKNVRIVINGAGASAISCTRLFEALGADRKNIIMLDSKGVIRADRENLEENKRYFATQVDLHTLEEALAGADVFVGLSKGNVVSQDMIRSMAPNPIVFALANPDPEIAYDLAMAAREDIIMATGRSDHPNQVNNVLGFPYIFRGALDVRASRINEEMKLAAVKALAQLAKTPVPEVVNLVYGEKNIQFGKNYIIPKPFDPRLIYTVSPAVAKAAMDSGVAKHPITDWDGYNLELKKRLGLDEKFMNLLTQKAKRDPKKVVFANADSFKVLKAAQIVYDEGIAKPILLGDVELIQKIADENALDISNMPIIDPFKATPRFEEYAEGLFEKRKRKGVTLYDARKLLMNRSYYGCMMLEAGEADAFVSGITRKYAHAMSPALQVIGAEPGTGRVSGMYIMLTKHGQFFFSDTSVTPNPTVEDIVDITISTANAVKRLGIKPVVALLSYSNFGSVEGEVPKKMSQATAILKERYPGLLVDGEMQANFAMDNEMLAENFPFSELVGHQVNTFIFPDLASANMSYKMLQSFGAAEAIGPVLIGLKKPVHILQLGSTVREIVNMVTIAVVDAQTRGQKTK
ncbi:MAG: NADP-dependent malic enzyme [Sphingobacteriaceae bacterium]|nr:NADP-dependent malic enzyme [Sphingobacteriaceae bacterium]